ncbi:MAG: hypothetical protein AB1671_02015 [Thermodesulfobacteriota bacterium]
MRSLRMKGVWGGLVLCLLTRSCGNREEPPAAPGPAEQLGREIDKAMQGAARRAEEMQKELGEKLEQAGKEMQKSHE